MNTTAKPADLLTVDEVATEAEVTAGRVRQWLRAGQLPGQKFGSAWVVVRSDLVAFMLQDRPAGNPSFQAAD